MTPTCAEVSALEGKRVTWSILSGTYSQSPIVGRRVVVLGLSRYGYYNCKGVWSTNQYAKNHWRVVFRARGGQFLREINLDDITDIREGWKR